MSEYNELEATTRTAASWLAQSFASLLARGIGRVRAQRFALQMLVGLFAQGVGLIERNTLTRLLEQCRAPGDSCELLGGLFQAMNEPGETAVGRYRGVANFDLQLLADPARLAIVPAERELLLRAARLDWARVRPEIFGTVFEQSLDRSERHALGAHFTHPTDIMKIVGPTIVEPWMAEIDRARAGARAPARLQRLRQHLCRYRVLDPACGCGNFLYVAYRELKKIENYLTGRIEDVLGRNSVRQQSQTSLVSLTQFHGMDVNPFAVELAKVTMMMARKLAIDEFHTRESALPLGDLDGNLMATDALLNASGSQAVWPAADVVIGNPPFLGAKRIKRERGVGYVGALRRAYPEISSMADYCVYWIRRTHDHLVPPTDDRPWTGRAGLVGTQNIRNNQSRAAGLDHVARGGTIISAVANQPWSGEARVHVSIVNWVKSQDPKFVPERRALWNAQQSVREVAHINSSLSDDVDVSARATLDCNKRPKRCFQGKIPGYRGFLLDAEQRRRLSACHDVIRPYLTGRELLSDFRIRRWCIDFRDLDAASAREYRQAFEHCRQRVLPMVEAKLADTKTTNSDMVRARRAHLGRWWQFWNRRDALTGALSRMTRYIGCSRVTRRPVMAFISSAIVPSDLVQVFAFEDDYSFGILQSRYHFEWFRKSSRLKLEKDLRYSVRAVFETFPWPQQATRANVLGVAAAARALRKLRRTAVASAPGGLRALYRTLDGPGRNPLRDAHTHLDERVRLVYGFSPGESILASLLRLNLDISASSRDGSYIEHPGVPSHIKRESGLVSTDCLDP